MPWLWKSFEQYEALVQPCSPRMRSRYREASIDSAANNLQRMIEAAETARDAIGAVRGIIAQFLSSDESLPHQPVSDEALSWASQTIEAGEELLLYHRRLAESMASYGFLHAKCVSTERDPLCNQQKWWFELRDLARQTETLLTGYAAVFEADRVFLREGLDLPPALARDFSMARDLFSVGFDEIGLLTAGRGLEGVLRTVARRKRIEIIVKGKATAAYDVDLFDLIEALQRVRWRATDERLLSKEHAALLHYLRTLRNGGAHNSGSASAVISPRESAAVVASTAAHIWNQVKRPRVRLAQRQIDKSW